jgi:PAS domain S-box-containing protein
MLQKFLDRFKVSTKLYFLVFILCLAIIAIAGYGLYQMNKMNKSTKDLYENRIVCMEQLVNVRHAYAKNIVFALQELKDGTITYHEAEKRIDAANTEIETNWHAYKLTYLTSEETKLAAQAEIMMHQADSAVADERALMDKSDTVNFSDLHPVKLFNITYALVEKLNELLKLQVSISKEIIEAGNREYKATVRNFYLLICSVLVLGILLFSAILFDANRLVESLQRSNKNLSENEEKLQTIIENAGDAIIIFDESLKIILANNYACRLLGYSNGELLTMKSMDILAPADREKHIAKVEELKSTTSSVHERKFLRKDGSSVETEANVQVLKGTGYISIIRDITERKRAEEAIKRKESEFRAFFDNIENAACLLDKDKRYVIFNKQFIKDHVRLTGTEPKVGQVVYERFPPEVQAERLKLIDNVLQSGNKGKIEIDVDYLRDGRRFYYRTAFNPVNIDSKTMGVSTISIDLTSIKEAEQKFKDLVEKSLTGVYIYDYEKFVYVNPRLVEMSGYTEEKLLTMNPLDFIHEDDREQVNENLRQRQEDSIKSFYYTAKARKKDGTIIWIEVLGSVTTYNGKKATIGTILDITENKKAELEITSLNESLERKVVQRTAELNEANNELEAFNYSVAHDLRAPLAIVHGYSQILLEYHSQGLDNEAKQMLNNVTASSNKMAELIDDLLSFSQVGKQEMNIADADMNKIANSALENIIALNNNSRAEVIINPLLPHAVDKNLMLQVFVNLISNAIKYSGKKDNPRIELGSYLKYGYKVYYVKDNGAGFDMKDYHRLFGAFQRLHSKSDYEGTGIGLALVMRIVTRHGGKVWAEAEQGKGATFYFSLPARGIDTLSPLE